jgi:hypothetical protein
MKIATTPIFCGLTRLSGWPWVKINRQGQPVHALQAGEDVLGNEAGLQALEAALTYNLLHMIRQF